MTKAQIQAEYASVKRGIRDALLDNMAMSNTDLYQKVLAVWRDMNSKIEAISK